MGLKAKTSKNNNQNLSVAIFDAVQTKDLASHDWREGEVNVCPTGCTKADIAIEYTLCKECM